MSAIVFKYAFEVTVNTRYEDFDVADIESAELGNECVYLKLKDGREVEFRLSDAVGTEFIEDVVDEMGEPVLFPVD